MAKIRKVMVGTPSYDGRLDVWYTNSLRFTERLAREKNMEITPIYMSYDSLVQRARNDCVQVALDGGFDDLVFIDSDMQWEPEWFMRLFEHDVDVVGAAYRKKTDDQELYTVHTTIPVPVDIKTGLWLVEGCGTGFLRFSRKALLALWDASEEYTNEGKLARWIFDVCPVNGALKGEDMIACAKLRELGFNIYLDPTFTPIHIGIKKYFGDFASYVELVKKQLAEGEAPVDVKITPKGMAA